MSFQYISSKYQRDQDYPERCYVLSCLEAIRQGTFYDILRYRFTEEMSGNQYVKLDDRKPNCTFGTNLITTTISDTANYLFGDTHFPEVEVVGDNDPARQSIRDWIQEAQVVRTMTRLVSRGSIGSAALHIHADTHGGVHVKDYSTLFLTPEFDRDVPNLLISIQEKYKVDGEKLKERGYDIKDDDLKKKFWFLRIWDLNSEIWYVPWTKEEQSAYEEKYRKPFQPRIDDERTKSHNLGFCPWIWVTNPGDLSDNYEDIDGQCWWKWAIDTCIFADYLVSQGGRALRYMSDPLLVVKEPVAALPINGGDIVHDGQGGLGFLKSPARMLTLSTTKDGGEADAKYLELKGDAANAIIQYAEALRSSAISAMGGNRQPDKMISHGGAKSLEILNASMVENIKMLRTTYSEFALRKLVLMFAKIVAKRPGAIKVNGSTVPASLASVKAITLRHPPIFASTPDDLMATATAYAAAIGGNFMSRDLAVRQLASEFDVEDVEAELALIQADIAAEDARALKLGMALKASETVNP